jgi:hypothetical protein
LCTTPFEGLQHTPLGVSGTIQHMIHTRCGRLTAVPVLSLPTCIVVGIRVHLSPPLPLPFLCMLHMSTCTHTTYGLHRGNSITCIRHVSLNLLPVCVQLVVVSQRSPNHPIHLHHSIPEHHYYYSLEQVLWLLCQRMGMRHLMV